MPPTFTKYTNVIPVTVGAGLTLSFAHGLRTEERVGLVPNMVLPDRDSALVVVAVDDVVITVNNPSAAPATANFLCQLDFSTQRDPDAPDVFYWQGGGGGGGGGVDVTETLIPGPTAMTSGVVDFGATPAPSNGTYIVRATMYFQPGAAGDGGVLFIRVNGVSDIDSSITYADATFGGCFIPIAIQKKYVGVLAGQVILLRAVAAAGSALIDAVLHIERIGP